MKAIVLSKYGSTDDFQLREVEKPIPKDDEVLIKVHAASVNDWDLALMSGKPRVYRLVFGLFKPKAKILGIDIAGQVEAVGNNVTKFKPGDEAFGDISECGFGGFAEYVCVQESSLALKPSCITFAEAAATPHAAMLATQCLFDKGNFQQGQKILINGAGGGVGTFAVQIIKLTGAEVTGVDSSDKFDMMRSMGFDHVIDYTQEDFTKNSQRYDLIIDTKTNRSVFDYRHALKPNGIYATVGGSLTRILQASLIGPLISMFSAKKICVVILKPNKDLDYLNELFEAGKIKPVIDSLYELSEVPEAIKYFEEGKHKGKVIINVIT